MDGLLKPLLPVKEPDVVYHYTSLETMMKILEDRTIWATDFEYLNDVSERTLLLDMVDSLLPDFSSANEGISQLPFARERAEKGWLTGPYVASFSKDLDSLYQWRSYCLPAKGVAIGFKMECLKQAFVPRKFDGGVDEILNRLPAPEFKAIEYIDPSHLSIARQVMTVSFADAAHTYNGLDLKVQQILSLDQFFRSNVNAAASFYKHKGFQSEAEYRLLLPTLYWHVEHLKCRCTPSSLIPYVALSIPASNKAEKLKDGTLRWDAVSNIMVGPSPNKALTLKAVKLFCQSIGLSVDVSESSLPYRDW